MNKIAVVLFNLGGPDGPGAVRPFLFNLFNDEAIIGLPQPLRWIAAKIISFKRFAKARAIYQEMGGKSPILDQTILQAQALEALLKEKSDDEYKVFTCMRYWHPMSDTVAKNIKNHHPDRIILLPLYPQFSTTTTASSFKSWNIAAAAIGLDAPTAAICCYPTSRLFAAAHVKFIKDGYWKAAEHGKPRVLFSAHGLPEKVIEGGDPYQFQVEQTAAAIIQILAIHDLDYRICYQSRIGPLAWIGPSIEEEIQRAAIDKAPLIVVPVAFVSEHSETLVELDVKYRQMAQKAGVPDYQRVRALSAEPLFIEALAEICLGAPSENTVCSFNKKRVCARTFTACPHKTAGVAA